MHPTCKSFQKGIQDANIHLTWKNFKTENESVTGGARVIERVHYLVVWLYTEWVFFGWRMDGSVHIISMSGEEQGFMKICHKVDDWHGRLVSWHSMITVSNIQGRQPVPAIDVFTHVGLHLHVVVVVNRQWTSPNAKTRSGFKSTSA